MSPWVCLPVCLSLCIPPKPYIQCSCVVRVLCRRCRFSCFLCKYFISNSYFIDCLRVCLWLVDKDLVSKPPDKVEETEPWQWHQLSHADPAVFFGRSWTARRRQLLPPRSFRRRPVARRSPLPVWRAKGHRRGSPARLMHARTERFRIRFRKHFLLSTLPTFHAAYFLTKTDWFVLYLCYILIIKTLSGYI